MSDQDDAEFQKSLLDSAANGLMEHFDSVRIFVTSHDGPNDETRTLTTGRGNLYAQLGQVQEWAVQMDEEARKEQRKEPPEEDEP